jgi:uncharacterized protein (TIGR03067 family)
MVSPAQSLSSENKSPSHLEECWDEPAADLLQADLAVLQGAWATLSGRRMAEFLVSGQHFTVHFVDGDIYMGSFTLDPTAWPKRMDVCIDEGPSLHKGQSALCIYEVDGDTLRWCTAGPGQRERPASFTTDDRHSLSLIFQREKKLPSKG